MLKYLFERKHVLAHLNSPKINHPLRRSELIVAHKVNWLSTSIILELGK